MLNIDEILKLLPHRFPMLLVDKVDELSSDHAVGYKFISYNEPYFQGHYPNNPVLPGIIILESLTQLIHIMVVSTPEYAEVDGVYYSKIAKSKFYAEVKPGSILKLEIIKKGTLDNLITCNVCASVEDNKVFTGDITVMLVTSK